MPTPQVQLDGESWGRVLLVMERLASSSNLEDVLQLIIDAVQQCLLADRASVLQYDPETDELFASRAHGVDDTLRFPASVGLAGEALQSAAIINVPDCYNDNRFNQDIDKRTGYTTRCLLSIPLVSHDGTREGVVQALNKVDGDAFDERDETIARALASQAAVALRRARLIEAERERNRMEADLRVAREIQLATQPGTPPDVEHYDIAVSNRSADETGGDAFDVFRCDAGITVFMADATGHGVGPAISAVRAHSMLRLGLELGVPLDTLVERVNTRLVESQPVGRFVTAFVGILDVSSHQLRYIAAGQAPIVVLRADGGMDRWGANATPLGIDRAFASPKPVTIDFGVGDVLVLLSDGFYECQDADDRAIGEDALIDIVRAHRADGLSATLAALTAAVETHAAGRVQDDRTGVLVGRIVPSHVSATPT